MKLSRPDGPYPYEDEIRRLWKNSGGYIIMTPDIFIPEHCEIIYDVNKTLIDLTGLVNANINMLL